MGGLFAKIVKSPIAWGGILSLGFYALIFNGYISGGMIERYFAQHPVEYVIGTMFFVGIAAIGLIYFGVLRQYTLLQNGAILPKRNELGEGIEDCPRLLDLLNKYESQYGSTYHSNRLRRVLESAIRSNSIFDVESDLRYIAEEDAEKAESGYGFVRMILWAIPMLGFLGTVIGIALALGNLSPEAMEQSLPAVMAGLTVAFDTTALAIALDIGLYFLQFIVSREETKLLWTVEQVAESELRGRFFIEEGVAPEDQKHVFAVRKMLGTMIGSIEELVKKQSQIWERSIEAANEKYSQMVLESSSIAQSVISKALSDNLDKHAASMVRAEETLIDRTRDSVRHLVEVMYANVDSINGLQNRIVTQGELFQAILAATGDIAMLEERLNKNLVALSGKSNFEETIEQLAATIHLLNAKHLGGNDSGSIQLHRPEKDSKKGYAA